jgi:hypothetical protein
MMDGLNTFYSDFRNRNIHVEDATGYIRDQIRGVSEDTLSLDLQICRDCEKELQNRGMTRLCQT